MNIKTHDEIKQELTDISRKYSVSGVLPELIIDLLTYYIEQNQANLVSLGLEGNLDTAENWDNIITLCGSLMYSVKRPSLARIAVPVWSLYSKGNTGNFENINAWDGSQTSKPKIEELETFGTRFLDDFVIEKALDEGLTTCAVQPVFKSFLDYFQHINFDPQDENGKNLIYEAINAIPQNSVVAKGEKASLVYVRTIHPDMQDENKDLRNYPIVDSKPGKVLTMGFNARTLNHVADLSYELPSGKSAGRFSVKMNLPSTKYASRVWDEFGGDLQWSVFMFDLCGDSHKVEFSSADILNSVLQTELSNLSSFSIPSTNLAEVLVENYKDYKDRTLNGRPAIYMITTPGYGVKFQGNEFIEPDQDYSIELFEYVAPEKETISDIVLTGDDWHLDLNKSLDNLDIFPDETTYLAKLEESRKKTTAVHKWYVDGTRVVAGINSLFTSPNEYAPFFTMHSSSVCVINSNQNLESKDEAKRRAWVNSKTIDGIVTDEDVSNYVFSLNSSLRAVTVQHWKPTATQECATFYYTCDDTGPISIEERDRILDAVKETTWWVTSNKPQLFMYKAVTCVPEFGDKVRVFYTGDVLNYKTIDEFYDKLNSIILTSRGDNSGIISRRDDRVNTWDGNMPLGVERLTQLFSVVLKDFGAYFLAWDIDGRTTALPSFHVTGYNQSNVKDIDTSDSMNNGNTNPANSYIHDSLGANSRGHEFHYDFRNTNLVEFIWKPY